MPHLRFLALSILFSVAVVSSPAAGQTIPSPYTYIEYSQEWVVFGGKSDLNPGQLGLGPQNATTVGGRWAAAFGGAMSFEVSGTMFMATREVRDVSKPVDDRVLGVSDIDVGLLDLRLRLNLTGRRAWHGLQPFIIFGGGVAGPLSVDRALEGLADMPTDEQFAFGTRFAGTVGGGANFHVSNKISLRLEGVMNLWKIQTPVGWVTVANDREGVNVTGEWVSAKSIMVGASWRF